MERRLYLTALIVFLAAGSLTLSSARMTGSMPMPGGWMMGMAWMRMPDQGWLGAGAMFAGMWLAMMVTMMLPSSLPMLLLYRHVAKHRSEPRADILVWLMAAAYFLVWTIFGIIAYVAGVAIADQAMRSSYVSRAIPAAAGLGLVLAGAYQLTAWKSACLKHCRDPLELVANHLHGGWRGAIGLGLHHGLFCMGCCWALMLMQFVLGVMNLSAMVLVASVIALEKLTPRGERLARAVGVMSIAAGAFYLLRTLW